MLGRIHLPRQLVPTALNAHGPLVFLGRALCFAQRLHNCRITVVEEAAGFCVQRSNRRHIFRTEVDIEHVEILRDAFWAHGFRNCHDAALGQPAQNDLRYSFLILARDGPQQLILENVVLAFREWPPGFNLHVISCRNFWVSIC